MPDWYVGWRKVLDVFTDVINLIFLELCHFIIWFLYEILVLKLCMFKHDISIMCNMWFCILYICISTLVIHIAPDCVWLRKRSWCAQGIKVTSVSIVLNYCIKYCVGFYCTLINFRLCLVCTPFNCSWYDS